MEVKARDGAILRSILDSQCGPKALDRAVGREKQPRIQPRGRKSLVHTVALVACTKRITADS